MYDFNYVKPGSLAEAVSAVKAGGQPISGGQTLIPTMKARLASPDTLVNLEGLGEMIGVSASGGVMTIGGDPHAMVAKEAAGSFPGLAGLAGGIGDRAVRARGTIGGSLANNDPAACYPSAALGTGATIVTSEREIAADDYFQGMFATALNEGEVITGVRMPIPEASNYQKFVQPASRFALVGVFVAKYSNGVRVAVTGASESGVFRWADAEAALSSNFSADAVAGLTASPDGMLTDIHGDAAYRAHLVGVMTRRAVAAAS